MNISDLHNAAPLEKPGLLATQFIARLSREAEAAHKLCVTSPFASRHPVRRALGCLIEPEDGDTAQLLLAGDTCWVLTILERPDPEAALTLDAGARALDVRGSDIRVTAHKHLQLTALRLHSRAELCVQHTGERHSHVEGLDTTHAGSAQIHVDQHLGLHAQSAVITASALLKLDGGQIHMG